MTRNAKYPIFQTKYGRFSINIPEDPTFIIVEIKFAALRFMLTGYLNGILYIILMININMYKCVKFLSSSYEIRL